MPRSLSRRLMFSVMIIVAWFGLIAEGAHALITDTATLTGNSISTGSTDLQISNSQSGSSTTFADSRTGFSYFLNPGETGESYFLLKNASSSNTMLDIDVTAGNAGDSSPDLISAILVELTPVDSAGVATGVPISRQLQEYIAGHINLGATIDKGKTQRFKAKIILSPLVNLANQSINYDLVFTGTQHVGS